MTTLIKYAIPSLSGNIDKTYYFYCRVIWRTPLLMSSHVHLLSANRIPPYKLSSNSIPSFTLSNTGTVYSCPVGVLFFLYPMWIQLTLYPMRCLLIIYNNNFIELDQDVSFPLKDVSEIRFNTLQLLRMEFYTNLIHWDSQFVTYFETFLLALYFVGFTKM